MIEYSFLFEDIKPKAHCSGKNGEPPLVSGASNEKCDLETGCVASGGVHHMCAAQLENVQYGEALYCECGLNDDKSPDYNRTIRHYFRASEMGHNPGYSPTCAYCWNHCRTGV